MKKFLMIPMLIITFLLFSSIAYSQCNDQLQTSCSGGIGADFKYLKNFPVKLAKSSKEAPVSQKYQITLSGGTTYKFTACNASELEGKVIVSLYNGFALVATTYVSESKKHYPYIEFPCKMSGNYNLTFYFEDGKEGCAVCILSQKN
jgi:hypothetical protein